MKILLNHCVNKRFREQLTGHETKTAREMGWDELKNGELLRAAETGGFSILLTVDKKLRYEQKLDRLPVSIVIMDSLSNALADLLPFASTVRLLMETELKRAIYFVERDYRVTILGKV